MILLEQPFVSELFKKTIVTNRLPVIGTTTAKNIMQGFPDTHYIEETLAIETLLNDTSTRIYTNSENAYAWTEKHLKDSLVPQRLKFFKNKVDFRKLIRPLFPDYFFKAMALADLGSIEAETLPFPIIVKPAVGFASIGVHKVEHYHQWDHTVEKIQKDFISNPTLYPREVIDQTEFIIEACIEGDEFAIDCYYDTSGNVTILNIMQHWFASSLDVGDRIYITSKNIIETHLEKMSSFLQELGNLTDLKDFVLHVEVRKTPEGIIVPIEVNPMRFGGWCTTADTAIHAYGINPYEFYLHNKKPDWKTLLQGKEDLIYAMIVLDNSSGIDATTIESFDYEALASDFVKPLEIRKVNFSQFPLFGFLFTETPVSHQEELTSILSSDLKKYIRINSL